MTSEELEHLLTRIRLQARAQAAKAPAGCGDADELFSVGEHALVHALERWDPALGGTLEFYVLLRTRGAMLDYLREIDPSSRRARAAFKSSPPVNRRPSSLNVHLCLDAVEHPAEFLDSEQNDNGSGAPELSLRESGPLVPALLTLNPIEQFVVWQSVAAGAKLHEIGSFLDVTAARVQQIEKAALPKLRRAFLQLSLSSV
jgi:RNA polymerase sigma factor for flagellar operon FliA